MEWIQSMCPLLWQENCTALQGKAACPMCNCAGTVPRNAGCRENPCLEGTQRDMPGPQSLFLTGDSPPSKMQLDVVLLSALCIRGTCPKSALGNVAGSFSAELEFLSKLPTCSAKKQDLWKQEEHPCLTPAQLPASLCREIYCVLVPAPAVVCAFHIKYLQWKKKDLKIVARNLKYFSIYLHYLCFGLQTLKSSPRQEILYQITSVPVD